MSSSSARGGHFRLAISLGTAASIFAGCGLLLSSESSVSRDSSLPQSSNFLADAGSTLARRLRDNLSDLRTSNNLPSFAAKEEAAVAGDRLLLVSAPAVLGSDHPHAARNSSHTAEVRRLVAWDLQNKLPPWESFISEGAEQGVALVLGQSLKPDGKPSQVLIDRAQAAKHLLASGKVSKVIVSGGDAAGVGRTEAANMADVLANVGISRSDIIQESQALSTAENIWFALRWIPKGTGHLYLVTSDFHMARATYIAEEVLGHFYRTFENAYRDDPRWPSHMKHYPRLELHQSPVASFCGSDASLNRDDDPKADISYKSLGLRVMNELTWMGTREVPDSLFGPPVTGLMYIWPVQINVSSDPSQSSRYRLSVAQSMYVLKGLCQCKAPPEGQGPEIVYPLHFPLPSSVPADVPNWKEAISECERR